MTDAEEIAVLRALVADLVRSEPNPCRIDHSGACQEHYWFGEDVCPYQRAKQMGIR